MACAQMIRTALVFAGKLWLLVSLGGIAEQFQWWQWLVDPNIVCGHEPLPVNQSGVKALAAGPAKTGTSSMVEAFHQVGLTNTYHGCDVHEHVLSPLLDEFWRRPENGGDGDPRTIPSPRAPAYMATVFMPNNNSMEAFSKVRPEELATAISRCRVDAMSFDAVESMILPVYDVSPGAKVLVLSWRTYDEYTKSRMSFGIKYVIGIYGIAYLYNSVHLLPWGKIIFPAFNMFTGGHIERTLRDGTSLTFSKGASLRFYHNQVFNRHDFSLLHGGMPEWIFDEEQYWAFFERIRKHVPAKDRMEWNFKKNTMRDLCDFLGINDHPGCDNPVPRVTVETFRFERNEPAEFLALCPLYIFCHIVNYKLLYGTLGLFVGLIPSRGRAKAE